MFRLLQRDEDLLEDNKELHALRSYYSQHPELTPPWERDEDHYDPSYDNDSYDYDDLVSDIHASVEQSGPARDDWGYDPDSDDQDTDSDEGDADDADADGDGDDGDL
jgi:hypothetical protein